MKLIFVSFSYAFRPMLIILVQIFYLLPTHIHPLYQRIKMFYVLLGSHIGKW